MQNNKYNTSLTGSYQQRLSDDYPYIVLLKKTQLMSNCDNIIQWVRYNVGESNVLFIQPDYNTNMVNIRFRDSDYAILFALRWS